MPQSSILDPVQATLPPHIWENPESPEPTLRALHAHFITSHIYDVMERGGYTKPKQWLKLYLTGSLCTYQYSDSSDADVSLFIDSQHLPEWSRAEMIGMMIEGCDGVTLPGTPYELQAYVVSRHIKPAELFKPGLRAGYSIDDHRWVHPPDHRMSHDVEAQENGFYAWSLQSADKMERLLRYEPDKAVDYWHQIHRKRMRDETAGKGDFSEANILYKFLAKRNLLPAIAQTSGEHIANLQGLPGPVNVPGHGVMQFGTNPDIERVANEYNQANGLGQHPTDYLPVNPQVGQRIAQEYEQMQHNPQDPTTQAAYQALANESLAQYHHAVNNGYNFEFYPQGSDPYPNSPREAVMDLQHNKHMYVYPTATGYGDGQQGMDHPLLADSGEQWNGQPVTHNDVFRAIHDFYGHAKEGLGFRHHGEDNAYRQHAAMFSPLAQRALASETRGQNSFVNFGPNGTHNQQANQGETIYAPQKAGLMPDWVTDPDLHKRDDLFGQRSAAHQNWPYVSFQSSASAHGVTNRQPTGSGNASARSGWRDPDGERVTSQVRRPTDPRRMVRDQRRVDNDVEQRNTNRSMPTRGSSTDTARSSHGMAQGATSQWSTIGERDHSAWQGGRAHQQDTEASSGRHWDTQDQGMVSPDNLESTGLGLRTAASQIASQAYEATMQSGGITIGLGGDQPSSGYAFSPLKSDETIVPMDQFTPESVDHFITDRNRELHAPGHYLGIWVSGDQVYLDVSIVEPDYQKAYDMASRSNQLAMYDLDSFDEIPIAATVGV